MSSHATSDIRNIAILGHAGAGKTTLIEALLHKAGVIGAAGSVEKGTTVCDFEPEAKAHQHSLSSTVVGLQHHAHRVNLMDTPGLPEFLGHTLSVLPAVETAAIVINAHLGIEPMTRRLMQEAKDRQLCRLIVVNKMDGARELQRLVEQIQDAFGRECLPINLPSAGGSKVVDVFDHDSGDSDFYSVAQAHAAITDQVVEVDADLMARYLEKGSVTAAELHEPLERCLREGHLIPVCFTSARTGAGLAELLDIFADLMPSPLEGNPPQFEKVDNGEAHPLQITPDAGKHVVAHVFKVTMDPFVGKLGIFRIHQGTVTKDTQLYAGEARKPFKVSHLYRVQGAAHQEVDQGMPGDICALAKVDELHRDVVLHDSLEDNHLRVHPVRYPEPMVGLAVTAKARGDEQKIARALSALQEEDPCFHVERNGDAHETIIRGLGDLHLRVLLEKMQHRYHAEVQTSPPRIAYRESITGKAEGHHRHKKQTGGAGQFGEVYLRVEPLPRGSGFEFVNDTFGGSIPGQFIPAVEKGVRQVLSTGAIAGYPLQDIRVSVYDGKSHDVDSKEIAFVTAGRKAFIAAVQQARPVILEPVVKLEITVPQASLGDVTGDLSGKRGRIQGTDLLPGDMAVVQAFAPLAELSQYQNQLKSATGGQGSYSMELSHYEPVPSHIQQRIIAAYKPHAEEE